jgi:hypothetical protein
MNSLPDSDDALAGSKVQKSLGDGRCRHADFAERILCELFKRSSNPHDEHVAFLARDLDLAVGRHGR